MEIKGVDALNASDIRPVITWIESGFDKGRDTAAIAEVMDCDSTIELIGREVGMFEINTEIIRWNNEICQKISFSQAYRTVTYHGGIYGLGSAKGKSN